MVHVGFIGGGIVGLAVARARRARGHGVPVCEKEPCWAMHQTGCSSEVIHSGLYYRPGAEARFCVAWRRRGSGCAPRQVHVLNAQRPAATLEIASTSLICSTGSCRAPVFTSHQSAVAAHSIFHVLCANGYGGCET